MKVRKSGLLLADLHFGAIDSTQLQTEIHELLEYILKYRTTIDFIIFLGDLFDHKLYLSEPSTRLICSFIGEIAELSKKNSNRKWNMIKIRMIYGTESHECNQYDGIFSTLISNPELDFKIIKTVTDEELFEGVNVLYLPEEYLNVKKSEYYKEFFLKDKFYDYIFGHGVITEIMTMIKKEKEDFIEHVKSPRFTMGDFKNCCKGKVYFGHYHIHSNIDDFAYYVGSFSRWMHGEEEEKGFMHIFIDGKKYTEKFIENPYAIKYKTIFFGYDHNIFNGEENFINQIKSLDKMIDLYEEKTHIRLLFNIPENYPNPEFFIRYIREHFRSSKFVTFNFVNGYENKKRMIDKEELNSTIEKYDYIIKKEQPIGTIVSNFIKDKTGKVISPDSVTMYLNQDIQDLITSRMNSV